MNLPISAETIEAIPSSVNPGQTIPKTPVKLVNDFTGLLDSAHALKAVAASGGSPDLTADFVVNNKPIVAPIQNVVAPKETVPAGEPSDGTTWFDTATGTTVALPVPKDAAGTILVQGPTKFTIESTLFTASGASFPTALGCTAVQGKDLTIAHVAVVPTGSQTIDVTHNYDCDLYAFGLGANGLPNGSAAPFATAQPITDEIKATIPSAVAPGGTIPAIQATDTFQMPPSLAAELSGGGVDATIDAANLPGAALSVDVAGKITTSPLTDVSVPTPAPVGLPWPVPTSVTTTPISVPAGTGGAAVTLSSPELFNVTGDENVAGTGNPFALLCTATDADLSLGTVAITAPPASAAVSAASPKATAFGTSVSVPVAVTATEPAPKQATAGGTQNIDVIKLYSCTTSVAAFQESNANNPSTIVELKASFPASVHPGDAIPAGDASIGLALNNAGATLAQSSFANGDYASVDKVSIPDVALDVNGTASPLTDMADTASEPEGTTAPWLVEADGQTSPISVPANATGDVIIGAPGTFAMNLTLEPSAAGTAAGDAPIDDTETCTAIDPSFLASIHVVQPAKAAPAATPTGKVLIMRGTKGIAQANLVKGKGKVVIPGTALPVGKSTLTVRYPGDSNTLAAPSKTITVVKTKASPSLAVHVTPGKVAAGAVFPTVNVKLSGPGKAHGGKFTVTVGGVHKTANLLFDGTQSVQLPPFATAGHKVIRVSYAGNANFVAKMVTAGLNVTKTGLGKFVVKVKPGKIVAKKTRATLLITLGAPDKLGHGLVTVRLAGRVIAKKVIAGAGKITLPKFPSAGRKVLHLTFAGNGSVVAKTVTHAVKVVRAPKHHRK